MSYARPFALHRALGADAPTVDPEAYRYDRWWDFVCNGDAPAVTALRRVITDLHGTSRVTGRTTPGEWQEDDPLVSSLRLLWVRMGKRTAWWPGAGGEYNFGPTTYQERCGKAGGWGLEKPSNAIRLSRELHQFLVERAALTRREETSAAPYPPALWVVAEDGYVRLRVDDPLLEAILRLTLIPGGFVPATSEVSVKDESTFVRGLERWVRQWIVEQGRDRGGDGKYLWPGDTDLGANTDVNFGPNTAGDELRIHRDVLFVVLNGGQLRARSGAPRPDVPEVRAAIYGALPGANPKAHKGAWRPTGKLFTAGRALDALRAGIITLQGVPMYALGLAKQPSTGGGGEKGDEPDEPAIDSSGMRWSGLEAGAPWQPSWARSSTPTAPPLTVPPVMAPTTPPSQFPWLPVVATGGAILLAGIIFALVTKRRRPPQPNRHRGRRRRRRRSRS